MGVPLSFRSILPLEVATRRYHLPIQHPSLAAANKDRGEHIHLRVPQRRQRRKHGALSLPADVLHKANPDRPNEVFAQISESRVGRAIRTADYAYSVYAPGINGGAQPAADLYADDFFYDLKKDPYELNNLIDDPAYTQVKQELRKKLLKWIRLAENAEPEIVDG